MEVQRSACRGCGKPIIWGVTEDGKKIPLDPTPPVYILRAEQDGETYVVRASTLRQYPAREKDGFHLPASQGPSSEQPIAMVSHFATCPKASEFGGGRKS